MWPARYTRCVDGKLAFRTCRTINHQVVNIAGYQRDVVGERLRTARWNVAQAVGDKVEIKAVGSLQQCSLKGTACRAIININIEADIRSTGREGKPLVVLNTRAPVRRQAEWPRINRFADLAIEVMLTAQDAC